MAKKERIFVLTQTRPFIIKFSQFKLSNDQRTNGREARGREAKRRGKREGGKGRLTNVFVDEILASLGGFALGISLGWNSKASIVLRNYVDASATEIGLIGGILNGGICIGAILIPFIVGRISRTNILFWTMPVLILTWTLMISNRRQKVRITFKSM